MLGANPVNSIVRIVYDISNIFVAPFRGLFSVNAELGASRFEVETLVAIVFYSLIAWALVRAFGVRKRTDIEPRV